MGLKRQVDCTVAGRRVVALIPAKLTSVRVPCKNIADLGGYPMFYYSVRAAQLCPEIDRVYVSSEAQDILDLAAGYGAEIIPRPAHLSAPEITNLDVLKHALSCIAECEGTVPDFVVLMQPTHPLRMPETLSDGIRLMQEAPDADTLVTVVRSDLLHGEIVNDRFVPEFDLPRNKSLEPERYRVTGSFYIFRTASTLARGLMYTDAILPLVLQQPEFEVDVDEQADLLLARCILEGHRESFAPYFTEKAST